MNAPDSAGESQDRHGNAYDRDAIVPGILLEISGGAAVKDACAKAGITRKTLNQWALDDPAGIGASYARAREQQAHALAEEALKIADGADEEGEKRQEALVAAIKGADDDDKDRILQSLQSVAVQRDRLRVDTRKWYTSKIAPKLYGEKLDVTTDGKPLSGVVVLPPVEEPK